MEKHKNVPPEGWAGFRDVDAKDEPPNLDAIKAFDEELMDEDNEELDEDDSLS